MSTEAPPETSLDALLSACRSRGEIKRLGEKIDADPTLKALFLARAGVEEGEVSGKKLVRLCLDRAEESQVVSTLTRRDEAFVCGHCGKDVGPGGAKVRDHCPFCLWSRHVDDIPGDRASNCGQLMRPVAWEMDHGTDVIRLECVRCGFVRRMRAHPEDDRRILIKLNPLPI